MVRENMPRVRILAECDVPDTAYYRRALSRGDLERVDGERPDSTRKTTRAREE